MNKKGIIITIVVFVIALLIGFGSSYVLFGTKECEKEKCEEIKDNTLDEKENIVDEKKDDINKDIEEFINYTNTNFLIDEELVGISFNGNITDSYKIVYSIGREFENLDFKEIEDSDDPRGEKTMSKSELEKIVLKYFTNVNIENKVEYKKYIHNTYWEITCEKDNCLISYYKPAVGGTGYYDKYTIKLNKLDGNKYLVRAYYLDYDEECVSPDNLVCPTIILDRKDSKNKVQETFNVSELTYNVIEKLNKIKPSVYIISFDENNRFIESEVIR